MIINDIKDINFSKLNGLVPAIVQDDITRQILMLGFMNEAALEKTIDKGLVTFYSRTKKRLWQKGETSKNVLKVVKILPDCDSDSLLILAKPEGPTCHTGAISCFRTDKLDTPIIDELEEVICNRKKNPDKKSYTSSLFSAGENEIAKKIGEEATEVAVASLNESNERVISESADLVYHLLVLLNNRNISWNDVRSELAQRRK